LIAELPPARFFLRLLTQPLSIKPLLGLLVRLRLRLHGHGRRSRFDPLGGEHFPRLTADSTSVSYFEPTSVSSTYRCCGVSGHTRATSR
jgi:hypothetical protein